LINIPDAFYQWLFRVFTNLTGTTPVLGVQFQPQTAAPAHPVIGLVVLADGTIWNPGSGTGLYRYTGSAWHFIG